ITLASGNSFRMAMSASRPFISGICRSISVMSGWYVRNCWIASRPLHASPIKVMSGWTPTRPAIPSRTSGWSSTMRIRIREASALIIGLLLPLCLRGKCLRQPRTFSSGRVGDAGRNAQFHFGPCLDFAPHGQLTSNNGGAFAHAGQSVMTLPALSRENHRIDALSVVPHPQPEALIVITDFDLDLLCVCMKKGVSERFGSNLIHFVAEDGMQISRLTLNGYTECRAVAG